MLIGVTLGKAWSDGRWRHQCASCYLEAVLKAGGEPVPLPAETILAGGAALLKRFDGFVLSGGGDLDPALYGQETHPATGAAETPRDRGELMLIGCALEANRPLLAICRGIQVLNVALGGDLVQDLPSAGFTGHDQAEAREARTHTVIPVPDSPIHALSPAAFKVNSFHHQALGKLGKGLAIAGQAPDGVIEAVWLPGRPVLGVQWHPETYAHEAAEAAGLFRWLVTVT